MDKIIPFRATSYRAVLCLLCCFLLECQPENLLLVSESDDAVVKVADFGFAQKFMADSGLTTQCGTPGYVAPEILMRK